MNRPLGAILTGGRSTRMGSDKSDVMVAGETMLDRVHQSLGQVTGRIVLLGPDRSGYDCWPDAVHAAGPLAGLATALSRMAENRLLLVAVDHAMVRSDTLQRLIEIESDLPVVPVDDAGVRQVTCAVYPASIAGAAVDEATSSGSIQTLLDRVSFRPVAPDQWLGWGEDGRSWFSIDSPNALAEAESRYDDA